MCVSSDSYILVLGEPVNDALRETILADSEVDWDRWDELSSKQCFDFLRLSIKDIPDGNCEVETVLGVQLLDLGESIPESSLDSTNDNAMR